MTIGSLFSGAGGFEHAGELSGFSPLWASEIEPFPILVTTKRFPRMRHLGDIMQINGADIEPVDVITFGSPCQNLSIAGNRKGLAGTKSSLFYEAIRVIKEMRGATNGEYPKFIVWENVYGAFTSNGGRDFHAILQAIAEIEDTEVSIPDGSPWAKCGELEMEHGSIAWRTYDAQYWGVPQRRRRIYLVADFGGKRAAKIQFERESVYEHTTPNGKEKQTASPNTGNSTYLNAWESQASRVSSIDNVSVTLSSEGNGLGAKTGLYLVPQPQPQPQPQVYVLGSVHSKGWQSDNPTSGIYEAHTTRTIDTSGGKSLCNQGGELVVIPDKARALTARGDSSPCFDRGQNVVAVYDARGNGDGTTVNTLTGDHNNRITDYTTVCVADTGNPAYCLDRASYNQGQNAQFNISVQEEQAQTLVAKEPHAVAETLKKSSYIVRRLTPLECCRLQGFPDDWVSDIAITEPTEGEIDYWVCIFNTYREATGGKACKSRKQIAAWLKKPHSDSAEYKMWGNSLAIPNAYNVLQGIAEVLQNE